MCEVAPRGPPVLVIVNINWGQADPVVTRTDDQRREIGLLKPPLHRLRGAEQQPADMAALVDQRRKSRLGIPPAQGTIEHLLPADPLDCE